MGECEKHLGTWVKSRALLGVQWAKAIRNAVFFTAQVCLSWYFYVFLRHLARFKSAFFEEKSQK